MGWRRGGFSERGEGHPTTAGCATQDSGCRPDVLRSTSDVHSRHLVGPTVSSLVVGRTFRRRDFVSFSMNCASRGIGAEAPLPLLANGRAHGARATGGVRPRAHDAGPARLGQGPASQHVHSADLWTPRNSAGCSAASPTRSQVNSHLSLGPRSGFASVSRPLCSSGAELNFSGASRYELHSSKYTKRGRQTPRADVCIRFSLQGPRGRAPGVAQHGCWGTTSPLDVWLGWRTRQQGFLLTGSPVVASLGKSLGASAACFYCWARCCD